MNNFILNKAINLKHILEKGKIIIDIEQEHGAIVPNSLINKRAEEVNNYINKASPLLLYNEMIEIEEEDMHDYNTIINHIIRRFCCDRLVISIKISKKSIDTLSLLELIDDTEKVSTKWQKVIYTIFMIAAVVLFFKMKN